MSDKPPHACPHCGSHKLVTRESSRRVFITHAGNRIPLLTVNFSLDRPVIQEHATTFSCSCSWMGHEGELDRQG